MSKDKIKATIANKMKPTIQLVPKVKPIINITKKPAVPVVRGARYV